MDNLYVKGDVLSRSRLLKDDCRRSIIPTNNYQHGSLQDYHQGSVEPTVSPLSNACCRKEANQILCSPGGDIDDVSESILTGKLIYYILSSALTIGILAS